MIRWFNNLCFTTRLPIGYGLTERLGPPIAIYISNSTHIIFKSLNRA
nr:MAG TPA: hypothetical protein [Caudoviricetes sp.]